VDKDRSTEDRVKSARDERMIDNNRKLNFARGAGEGRRRGGRGAGRGDAADSQVSLRCLKIVSIGSEWELWGWG
jgi:hypothetical protein